MLVRLTSLILLSTALAAPARAEAGPADVARSFFAAYAAGDVEGAASYWSAADAGRFRVKAQRAAAARCLVVRDVGVRVGEAGVEKAGVEIDATAEGWAGGGKGVVTERALHKSLDLVREGGAWRVAAMRDREEAVADAIVAAPKEGRAAIARDAGVLRTPRLVDLLARRAMTMINKNDFDGAAQLLDLAQEVAVECGDGGAYAMVMGGRSTLLHRSPRHDIDAGVQLGEEAVSWAEGSDAEADVLAWSLFRLGRAQGWVLTGPALHASFERAVALADRVEQVATIAQAHSALASEADLVHDHRAAFRQSLLTEKYAEESGDPASRISAALNLGGAFLHQRDAAVALIHYEHAAALAREADFPGPLAFALQFQAQMYDALERHADALKTFDAALAIVNSPAVSDMTVAAEILIERAYARFKIGDIPAAESDLRELEPRLEYLAPSARGNFQELSANVLVRENRCEEALALVRQSCIPIGSGCAPSPAEIRALDCLGRRSEALSLSLQMVNAAEAERGLVGAEAAQLGFFQGGVEGWYGWTAQRLIEEGSAREGLAVAERLKARALRDAQNRMLVSPARLEGKQRVEYQQLNERIATLNRGMADAVAHGRPSEHLQQELEKARTAMRELLARADAAVSAPRPASPAPAQNDAIPSPPAGVVAIEYVFGEDYVIAFAVVKGECDPEITVRVVPVSGMELGDRIDRYVASIEQRDLRAGEYGRELYRLLVAPFEKLIAGHDAVCIIPSGELWRVPFHALMTPRGRYLAELANVYYAPSLAILHDESPRERRQPETLLALANPNLRAKTQALYRAFYRGQQLGAIPETEREVRALRSIYGAKNSRIYIGDQAQESVAKRESPKFRILHIAAHGIVDELSPMYSAVALSTKDEQEDGLLEAREIAELPLHADLAVLSACETARGRVSIGEGIVGLSWALMAAGCPTAVVSQWRTDSASTADLMIAFHRDLVRTHHRSPVQSLRRAQLLLMRNPRTAHPYYWAPFIVIGRDQ